MAARALPLAAAVPRQACRPACPAVGRGGRFAASARLGLPRAPRRSELRPLAASLRRVALPLPEASLSQEAFLQREALLSPAERSARRKAAATHVSQRPAACLEPAAMRASPGPEALSPQAASLLPGRQERWRELAARHVIPLPAAVQAASWARRAVPHQGAAQAAAEEVVAVQPFGRPAAEAVGPSAPRLAQARSSGPRPAQALPFGQPEAEVGVPSAPQLAPDASGAEAEAEAEVPSEPRVAPADAWPGAAVAQEDGPRAAEGAAAHEAAVPRAVRAEPVGARQAAAEVAAPLALPWGPASVPPCLEDPRASSRLRAAFEPAPSASVRSAPGRRGSA